MEDIFLVPKKKFDLVIKEILIRPIYTDKNDTIYMDYFKW